MDENAYVGGSPPQVRGKAVAYTISVPSPGITPAGAGKRLFFFWINFTERDHPRRCGEKAYQKEFYQRYMGSPPQVRGKVIDSCSISMTFRITPAGAGKSYIFPTMNAFNLGSPPQVRGKGICCCSSTVPQRITPAGAGKSGKPIPM